MLEHRWLYPREPWDVVGGIDNVLVHRRLDYLKGSSSLFGSDGVLFQKMYYDAKYNGDFQAARETVARCVLLWKVNIWKEIVERMVELTGAVPIIVYPRGYDSQDESNRLIPDRPRNALPLAFAECIQNLVGGEINQTITQMKNLKRTRLGPLLRFQYQPQFAGSIRPKRYYLLIDDVLTTGQTFASLRTHIIRGGGLIAGIAALAHAQGDAAGGKDQRLAADKRTLNDLKIEYGPGIETFWQETFGHGMGELTYQEARFLLRRCDRHDWKEIPPGQALLDRLRAKFQEIWNNLA